MAKTSPTCKFTHRLLLPFGWITMKCVFYIGAEYEPHVTQKQDWFNSFLGLKLYILQHSIFTNTILF